MNKLRYLFIISIVLFATTSFAHQANAEETITFSPTQIIVKETDLGKRYTITITNSSNTDYIFNVEERNAKKSNDQLELLDTELVLKRLEIPTSEFKVKANDKYELVVRVKIFTNESFDAFPSLVIKEKADSANQLKILVQTVIPFIIQNTKGESKIENSFSINAQNYTIDPKISLIGIVENTGTKFSNLSGTILILKDGKIIDEKEITSQISGLLFPGETRNYNIDWTVSQDYFDGLGEYTLESRVNNDETSNTSVMKISYIYIPQNLIILSLGSILGLALLVVVINVIVKKIKK
jgi:P pilus assembly chaperone PapD